MTTTTLDVHGMTCHACVRRVRDALRLEGVARVEVRLADGRVEIEHDARTSAATLTAAIHAAGYDAGAPASHATPRRGGCCGCC